MWISLNCKTVPQNDLCSNMYILRKSLNNMLLLFVTNRRITYASILIKIIIYFFRSISLNNGKPSSNGFIKRSNIKSSSSETMLRWHILWILLFIENLALAYSKPKKYRLGPKFTFSQLYIIPLFRADAKMSENIFLYFCFMNI